MVFLQKVKPSHLTHLNQCKSETTWCVTDLAFHPPGRIVISGSEHKSRLTFVSLFEIEVGHDGDIKAESLFKKELNRQTRSEIWRLVSFIDESTLVTCLDDSLEKISVSSRDVIHAKKLPFGDASCISVKNEEIFIGMSGSSEISVLNLQLLQTRVIYLPSLQNSWPIDLATTSDRTSFFCAVGGEDKIVVSVEDEGERLKLENPLHRDAVPLSITVCEDTEIVAVSWNDPSEVTLHAVSTGFCVGIAEIELVERIQSLGVGRLGAIDTTGEFKIFHVAQLFTFDNLKALLCNLFSQSDCQKLHKLFKLNGKMTKKGESFDDGDVRTFLDALEDQGHFNSQYTVSLRDAIKEGDFTENGQRVLAAIESYNKLSARGPDVDAERNLRGRNQCKKRSTDGTEEDKDWKKLKVIKNDSIISEGEEPGMNAESSENEHLSEESAPADQSQYRNASPDYQPDGEAQSLASGGSSLGALSHRLVSEFRTALADSTRPLLNELKQLRNELAKIRTLNENGRCSSSCGVPPRCSHSCLFPPCANRSSHCCDTHSSCVHHGCCHVHSNHHGNPATPQTCGQAQVTPTPASSTGQTLPQSNCSQTHCTQPNMINPFMHSMGYPQYLPGPFVPMQYPVMQQTGLQPTNQPVFFGNPALQHPLPPPTTVSSLQSQSQNITVMSTPVRGSTPGQSESNATTSNCGAANNQPQTYSTNVLNLSVDGTISSPSRDQSQSHENDLGTCNTKSSSSAKETVARVAGFLRTVPTKMYLGITPGEAEESAAAVKSCLQSSSHPTSFLNGFPSVLRKELLQYKDQDDPKAREQIVKVMMKTLFTQEERAESNCGGKGGYRQINREKLFLVKEIVFLVCPFVGGKDDEQTKAKEWKRLCTYIDVTNRHVRHKFRQLSKREEEANASAKKS